MIVAKRMPVGIDKPIQYLQKSLHDRLLTLWDISTDKYMAYGRCYRNQSEQGYVPEVYISEQKGYQDLLLDDRYAAISFFGNERQDNTDGATIADVHLIFAVNLSKVKPNIKHRADEEVHQDVVKYFDNRMDIEFVSMVTGIENVFREYTVWRNRDKGINYRDMQPFHFFRLNLIFRYLNNNC